MKRGDSQTVLSPTLDEAIAHALRVSDPVDLVYVHGETCPVDPSTGTDCNCDPMIMAVGGGRA